MKPRTMAAVLSVLATMGPWLLASGCGDEDTTPGPVSVPGGGHGPGGGSVGGGGAGAHGGAGANGGAGGSGLPTECNDGIDNDGDGLVDWQLDLGCYGPADATEGGYNDELEDGWTVFEAAANTTIYYVSSSTGDDAYSGLAPEYDGTDGPKRSVAAALALLEDGRPDWLLFKRGDGWVDETMGNWSVSGESADAPVIIASYGDSIERPRFEVADTWLITHGGGGASEQRSHVRGPEPDDRVVHAVARRECELRRLHGSCRGAVQALVATRAHGGSGQRIRA